jgi:diguanylate cyclase (GGDEF)-like protein/PAS domain S-box-containing protein
MFHLAEDRGVMPVSFVAEIAALLMLGPAGAVAGSVAAAAAKRRVATGIAAILSTAAASAVYVACGGAVGVFGWPFEALPVAAAAMTYGATKVALTNVAIPLIRRRPINREVLGTLWRELPAYFVGAPFAAAVAELIAHRLWIALAIAAVPAFFAVRAYVDYLDHLEQAHRRRQAGDASHDGLAVLDAKGRVLLKTDAASWLRDPAIARDIADTVADGNARTSRVALTRNKSTRTLEVKIVAATDGVTVSWHDATERLRGESAARRHIERLTLAAAGANDGLWEWDARSNDLYVSDRWKALVGLTAETPIARIDDWFARVHPDDAGALRDAFESVASGERTLIEHQHRLRHEDGSYRSVLCRAIAAASERRKRVGGSLTDITDQVVNQERLRSVGFRDPLTGLRNRTDFLEVLGRRLDEFKRRKVGDRFAVLYLDLDRFKIINDSLGHLAGDELLVAVSRRLESCLRQEDCLGRLGGDEFAILLASVGDESQANAIAFRIEDALRPPLSVANREVFTSASIGIAFGHRAYTSPDEIMRDADTAMYHAKAAGKARHELFDAEMHARARDRHDLEHDLRHAIKSCDFDVHYQPIVSLATGMCIGFESLVRWTRNGKPVSPAVFVPIAEELGVIDELGTWVLERACQTFADWQRRYPAAGLNCITVNASSRQLTQQGFPFLVHEAVRKAGLKVSDLRIEVTETALMDNPQAAAAVLSELRDYGVKIYLDDFGTGCSSLSHLHKLPVDALKIDRSFVMSLLLPDRPAIVESILALARTLKTSVVAEGIESDIQAHELERLGCTHAQGYLFSRPLNQQAAEQVIAANVPLGPKRALHIAV